MRIGRTIVFSLGGSLIVPNEVNIRLLKHLRAFVLSHVRRGNRVVVVCGGGKVCRRYNAAARGIVPRVSNADLDWLGIAATKLNAELVRVMFGEYAYERVLPNPTERVRTAKRILIGAGFVPGSSSDKDAVLLAKTYGARTVINLTNIDYVYDRDPRRFRNAKPLSQVTWPVFRRIVGSHWDPGANVPFDPVAAKLAEKFKLTVLIVNGTRIGNLARALRGKSFIGTIVCP
ncbi:MAG: UMP kinase [Patescibacteria group bacterium]|nr:UMP kinase [Patescibacteria group bacterium]MDD5715238.1 UMP kinase [Patescibacteria group bacterium]